MFGDVFGAPAAHAGIAGSTSSELRPYAALYQRDAPRDAADVGVGRLATAL